MRFVENQSGTYATEHAPDDHRRFDLSMEIQMSPLPWRLRGTLSGHVIADGLTERAALSGTVSRGPGGLLRYELQFSADDGRALSFRGDKRVSLSSLSRGLQELSGELFEPSGRLIATTTTRFSPRADLVDLLASLRWR